MKANKVPKKIYLRTTAKGTMGASWRTFQLTNGDIEYTHTNTFIKKACEWLRCNNNLIDGEIDDYVEGFKNYMKGE